MSITLSEALRLGRENSKCCDEHRHNLEIMGKKVEKYAAQNWQIQTFQELKIHHVLQLIRDMEKQGRKPSYIKHTMNTIRLASNYAKDYLELDVVKIEKRHLPQTLEAPKIWLTYRQLATACYVAMDTDVRRKPGSRMSRPRPLELARLIILTCGLCGLRLTEFGRLVPECLDSENNLTITKAKTDPSNRIIPLPSIVADALRAFWSKNGKWSTSRHSNAERIGKLFSATFDVTNDDLFLMTPPKNLRKSFVNELDGIVDDKYLMAYGGWAFTGTMYRNYKSLRPRPDDHKQVRDRAIAKLREAIVDEIEKKCTDLHF